MNSKMGILERGTSYDSVLEALRAAIIAGEFQSGSQLKQSVIAEKLGVSQGPVREALGRLTVEGLVETIPFRGMFVRKLAKCDVEEIYQVRMALEVLAFRLAFNTLREPKNIQMLEKLLVVTVEAAKTPDYEAAVAADLNFHRYLVELSDNTRLLKIWDSLLAQARFILSKLYALNEGANIMNLALNHEKLLISINEGDLNESIRMIEEHLEFARISLLDNWEEVVRES